MSSETFPGVSLSSHIRAGADSHVYNLETEGYFYKELRSNTPGGWMLRDMYFDAESQLKRARDIQVFFDHCKKYLGKNFQKPTVFLNTHNFPEESRICLFQQRVRGAIAREEDDTDALDAALDSELGNNLDRMLDNIAELERLVEPEFYGLLKSRIENERIPDLQFDNLIKTPDGEFILIDI